MTEPDIPELLSLITALAEYERLSDQVVASEDSLRESLFSEPRAVEGVIASVDGRRVGYAMWFHTFSTFLGRRGLYLEDLFVLPEWRGKGVGRALLAHVAGVALARRCGRMDWSVLDWNIPAITFYKGMGAVPMDEWTVFRLKG
ncbi:MAG TPA: GNAT family N-acetyltransferase, partial [Longimicrobiales bacterium]|nr:GNAT family N-acetyltransferase [Longimicrobiales bacterium]